MLKRRFRDQLNNGNETAIPNLIKIYTVLYMKSNIAEFTDYML